MRHPTRHPFTQSADPPPPCARATGRGLFQRLGRLPHRLPIILLALAVIVTALIPTLEHRLSHWLGERLSGRWVYAASQQTLARLDQTVLQPSALPEHTQAAIRSRMAALRMPAGKAPLYQLVFRQGSPYGVRSFSLAGGQIIVSDELVARLGEGDALMAALGIELGHLAHRHAVHAAVETAPMGLLLATLGDDEAHGIRLLSAAQPILDYDEAHMHAARSFAADLAILRQTAATH